MLKVNSFCFVSIEAIDISSHSEKHDFPLLN